MASISSPGIGSGLDVTSIINKLMAVESQPLANLEQKQSDYKAELSAVGQLKSALSSFETAMAGLNDATDFQLYSASSSDTSVLSATADSTAARGTYSVDVQRIAEQQKLGAGTVYADADTTTIGTAGDTMTITVGSNTPWVFSYGGMTLNDIRDAINSDSSNPGVTASVIHDQSGYRLLLSADDTGSAGFTTVDSYSSGSDPFAFSSLNQDRNGDGSFTSADLDAQLLLDNTYTVTSSSNTVSDMISGVTLTLASAGTTTLSIARDDTAITDQAQAFVDAYNALHSTLSTLDSGTLQGDNTILSIENQIRDILNTPPSGLGSQYSYLTEIGLTLQKDGTMSLDKTAFQTALNTDFNGVVDLFANNDQGYAYRLQSAANNLVQTGGILDARTDGINSRLDRVQSDIDNMQYRLTRVQQNYQAQFTALDTLISQLQNTGTYLTQQLSSIKLGGQGQ